MSRYLDPKTDVVFKKVFLDHSELLKSFLNAVLPLAPDALITHLDYLPNEQIPTIPALKRPIADVRCVDQQNRQFIVEMQIEFTDSFKQRLLFESSQAYVKQLWKGEDYCLLQPVYGLGLIGKQFDSETPDWYHHYRIVNVVHPKISVIEGLELIFIELPKFEAQLKEGSYLRNLWLRFMCEINEKTKKVARELLEVPEIRAAIELTEEAAYTEGELEAYRRYWDSVSSEKTLLSERREEGLAIGRAEGRVEGVAEERAKIAQNLKKYGLSLTEIAEITGLPIKEIEAL